MAYMKMIAFSCNKQPCKNRATHEVFNRRNAPYGKFCGPHALALLREIEREEQSNTSQRST